MIGTESGSSALDPYGDLRRSEAAWRAEHPDATFEEYSAVQQPGWDDYGFTAISPRLFEAAQTKTAQLLVEGEYDGILEADRHYMPLREDLSNLDEALERIADPAETEAFAERAWEDLILSGSYSYGAFAAHVETVVEEVAGERPRRGSRGELAWRAANAAADGYSNLVIRPPRLAHRYARRHAPWLADGWSARAAGCASGPGTAARERAPLAFRQPPLAGVRRDAADGARALSAHRAGRHACRVAPEAARARRERGRSPRRLLERRYPVPRRSASCGGRGGARHTRSSLARRPGTRRGGPRSMGRVVARAEDRLPAGRVHHAHVLDDWLHDLGVDVVFSIYGPEHRERLYPRMARRARFERALTGYVDERRSVSPGRRRAPHARRPLDLAYRAEPLPPRFGRLAQAEAASGGGARPARAGGRPAGRRLARRPRRDPRRAVVRSDRVDTRRARQRERGQRDDAAEAVARERALLVERPA